MCYCKINIDIQWYNSRESISIGQFKFYSNPIYTIPNHNDYCMTIACTHFFLQKKKKIDKNNIIFLQKLEYGILFKQCLKCVDFQSLNGTQITVTFFKTSKYLVLTDKHTHLTIVLIFRIVLYLFRISYT